MTELTFDEFSKQPPTYTLGTSGDWGSHRAYRNEEIGIQKEVVTKRKRYGDIYGGWRDAEVYYFVDGDPRTFRTVAECYVAFMEKACSVKEQE